MKCYMREVVQRVPINQFNKLGYILVKEFVKTDDISKFNYRKRIKFKDADVNTEKELQGLRGDEVYRKELKVVARR